MVGMRLKFAVRKLLVAEGHCRPAGMLCCDFIEDFPQRLQRGRIRALDCRWRSRWSGVASD
jgi:hypothetical protein